MHAEIVEDQQVLAFDTLKISQSRAFCLGYFKLAHQFGRTGVQHPKSVLAGFISECRCKIALARSCRSRNDNVFVVAYELHIRKPFDRFYLHRISNGLYAPGARLKGMSFEQFMHADTWFAKYLQTGEDEHLNLLVASLYMRKHETFVLPPQRNFHFFRKRKRLLNIEERVKDIARLDADTRYAVFLNFVMIRTWLSKAFPFLFPVSDEDKKMKGNGKSTAWLDIFDAFVGDDIPDIDSYRALPAATAFRILNKRIRNAQTRKR